MPDLKVPCRIEIRDRADGCKELILYINGRHNTTFVYDPRTHTISETNPGDIETKGYIHG
jgi:YD repeat-containing protein